MTSDFASNSLRKLGRAPAPRQLVQRLRNDQDEIRLATGRRETYLLDVRSTREHRAVTGSSGAETTAALALGGPGEQS